MQRRAFLSLPVLLAWPLRADSAQDAWDALTEIVSALGQGRAAAVAAALDPSAPDFAARREEVAALLRQVDVQSSLDLVENSGDDQKRTITVDWLLILTERTDAPRATRRKERVECSFVRRGKKWLLAGLTPAQFLKPPVA